MPTTEPLRHLIVVLARKIKSDAEKNFDGRGLSLFQYGVLKRAARGDSIQNDIAGAMGVKPPSLVPIIDWLDEHGYLVRKADATDRRKVILTVTKHGREILKKLPPPSAPAFEKAVRDLGEAKRRQLGKLLGELNEKIS